MKSLKIQGKGNYYLHPVLHGTAPLQSASLSLHLYPNANKKVPIEAGFRYFHIKDRLQTSIKSPEPPHVYHFSLEDVGKVVKIEVFPLENRLFSGVFEVFYGPVELDPGLRYTLANVLAAGGSKFRLKGEIITKSIEKSAFQRDYSLSLTAEKLLFSDVTSLEASFGYSLQAPGLEILDSLALCLRFTPECHNFEGIQAFFGTKEADFLMKFTTDSRNTRDLIVGAIRSFAVREFLINSRSIEQIVSPNIENWAVFNEIDRIQRELAGVLERNKRFEAENQRNIEEIRALKADNQEKEAKIRDFQAKIADFEGFSRKQAENSDFQRFPVKEAQNSDFLEKIGVLERENQLLRENNRKLKEQAEILENFNKNAAFFEESREISLLQDPRPLIVDLQRKYDESRRLNSVLLQEIAEIQQQNSLKQAEKQQNSEKQAENDAFRLENERFKQEISVLMDQKDGFMRKMAEKDQEISEIKRKTAELASEIESFRLKCSKNSEKPVFSENKPESFELKVLRAELGTLKAENEAFQRENCDLMLDRKQKMERILDLERENRVFRMNSGKSDKNTVFYEKNNDFEPKNRENEGFRLENEALKREIAEKEEEVEDLRFKYNAVASELRVFKYNKPQKPTQKGIFS